MARFMSSEGAQNLRTWSRSGVVKTLRCYSAEDADVCRECRALDGTIIKIEDAEIGTNLPPLKTCRAKRCRCYFRPWDISVD